MSLLLIDNSNQQFKKSSHFISSALTLIFSWPSVVSFPQFAHILILPTLKPCNYNESYWPTYTCSFGDCKELSVGPHRHILVCHVKQHLLILILEFKPNIFVLFGAANDTVVGSLQEKEWFYWKRNSALPNLEKTFPTLREFPNPVWPCIKNADFTCQSVYICHDPASNSATIRWLIIIAVFTSH